MPSHKLLRMSPYRMICLIGFFAVSSFSLLSPILSLFARDFVKATIFEIGIITSAFFIASAAVKIPLGVFGGGSRTPILFAFSLLLLMVLPYTYTLAYTPAVLAIIRIIHGIVFTLAVTVSLILAPITVPEHARDRAVATYSLLAGAGLVAGSALGTLSMAIGELRSVFYVASILAFPGFILGYIFMRRLYSIEKRWFLLDRPVQQDIGGKARRVLTNRMFLIAFLACISYFFAFGALLAYAPLYATQHLHFPYVAVALVFFGCYAATALTRLPLKRLISRWKYGKEMLAFAAQVLAVVLALVASLGLHPIIFVLAVVLFGVSQGVIYPVGAMMASATLDPSEHFLANSLYLVAWDLGLALGPVLTAAIASTQGVLSALAMSSILPAVSSVTLVYAVLAKARKNH